MHRSQLFIATVLTSLFATACAADGDIDTSSDPTDGFRVVTGRDASGFSLPHDVRFVSEARHDAAGLTAEEYQQQVGGADVFGASMTVFRNDGGDLVGVVGKHFDAVAPVNRVVLGEDDAIAIVKAEIRKADSRHATLYVSSATGRYFYLVDTRGEGFRWFHFVDAETGRIWTTIDALTTDTGTGFGVDGDTKSFATSSGSPYFLDSGRVQTHDQGSANKPQPSGTIVSDSDNVWDLGGHASPAHPALVDAHYYIIVSDDYYLNEHGFDFISRLGKPLNVQAHWKKNYVNAFWNGNYMAFGDGDQISWRELTSLDVAGHELGHAVTDGINNLTYANESGALNEAFSDMMAAAIEYHADGLGLDSAHAPDFKVGEDFDLAKGEGFRNMADPEQHGDPDHYSERYTGTSDNGGVHTNSGIANHAFYLVAQGGLNASCASPSDHSSAHCTGTETPVVGVGIETAAQIFYIGFDALNASSPMCEARQATVVAAGAFGATTTVEGAWSAVGVEDCGSGGGSVCGNGVCESDETSSSCAADCATCTGWRDPCTQQSDCCPGLNCRGKAGSLTCK